MVPCVRSMHYLTMYVFSACLGLIAVEPGLLVAMAVNVFIGIAQ